MVFQEIGLGPRLDLFGSRKGCASYILDAVSSIQFSLLLRCDVLDVTSCHCLIGYRIFGTNLHTLIFTERNVYELFDPWV